MVKYKCKGCDIMYMDYSKLWKLLIDKNITKTELMELTGISSRVLAKLSKNETITTETLSRICSALNCDVSNIMECKEESNLSFYKYFSKHGRLVSETELYKTYEVTYKEKLYVVHITKKSAKGTIINCRLDGTIYWEQLYPFGGRMSPSITENSLIKPIRRADEIVVVAIKGRPGFTGLDEGIYISSKRQLPDKNSVYVMSETSFKLFEQ